MARHLLAAGYAATGRDVNPECVAAFVAPAQSHANEDTARVFAVLQQLAGAGDRDKGGGAARPL